MSITRTILTTEYRVLRAPTRLVERRILTRLPAESLIRMGAEGGLGIFDTLAGRVVGDPDIRQRGTALLDRVQASWHARRGDESAIQPPKLATVEKAREDTDPKRSARKR